LNFGIAADFQGRCHLRMDDTNPVKEEQAFVDGIIDVVRWLGFDWDHGDETNLYYASDYFDVMAQVAQHLIALGYAYVDEQSADQIRHNRGTLTEPGVYSPWRNRPVEESLRRFEQMRAGEHAQGSMVVRARVDMASPNINLRDPTIYRIRLTSHHRTGADWKIYPMYSYAHPIEDALENITHSICTLEFEDQRPFYDWVLERAVPVLRAPQLDQARSLLQKIQTEGLQAQREFAGQCFNQAHKLGDSLWEAQAAAMFVSWHRQPDKIVHDAPAFMALLLDHTAYFTPLLQHALHARQPNPFALPHQHEFNRLSLTYVVTSKRKLAQLVQDKHVDGWDDPRMPTLVGLRRRGFTPSSLRLFNERLGVSKSAQWIDYALLEQALRDDLEQVAPRATAVLDPIKLIIDNLEPGHAQACQIPVHPHNPSLGMRTLNFERELWIERADFNEDPPKGYFRLTPGGMVRLRHAYVIRCTGVEKDEAGRVSAVHAQYLPETRSGTPGASAVKVKGAIHWLPVSGAVPAQLRLFDRLFVDAQPDVDETELMTRLNSNSKRVVQAYVEPLAAHAAPEHRFQFERNGYFVADRYDHRADAPVFNLAVGLKDSWGKASGA
ncbi:MAG TPA: glutamine--tRNA ligase, partial [Burkholderiaceae bacterium]|nr:glutamine--tRNA ligase [Burkholderiaceae bacterium]